MELNPQAQAIVDAIPRIISENRVDAEAIKLAFEQYLKNWDLPHRKILIFEKNSIKGWEFIRKKTDAARDATWDAARGAARDATWDAARDAARDATWDAARDAAMDAARDAARGAAMDAARDAARGAAMDAARGAAWGAAWDAARDATWDAARGAALVNACGCNKSDCKICNFRQKEKPIWTAFENGAFTYWITPEEVVVITQPKIYHTQGRLHREDGPALAWEEEKYWFLHGVKVDEKMHQEITGRKMLFKEIMGLENIEHRMVALKYMEPSQLLKDAKAQLVDTSSAKGNELWLIDNKSIFPKPELFLKYECPSTSRVYMKCVEREWALLPDGNLSADAAQARSHHWTLEEYLKVFTEA